MTSASWQEVDGAGAPQLTFLEKGDDSAFIVKNIFGGGKFSAEAQYLNYPEQSITAWTCELKRTDDARFNFHFELGKYDSKGKYQTLQL